VIVEMKASEALATFIGVFQSIIGVLCIALASFLYYNPDLFPIRTLFNLQLEHVPFYMMVLFIAGFFAIISGLLIIHEWSLGQQV
jgi:hypothetical protein